jgi:hypothetical protein
MGCRGKLKHRAGAVAAAGVLSLGGLVGLGLAATPAAASGCSHTSHWEAYGDGHWHWTTYNGYYNSNGVHWHLWSDAHGRYQSACY